MSDTRPIIFWFRQDLRLSDHTGLEAAREAGRSIIPLYILDTTTQVRPMGKASLWWLHHSLESLGKKLPLVLRKGPAAQVLDEVIKETGAVGVFWSRCYEPYAIERDKSIKEALQARGLLAHSYNNSLLFEPWEVKTKTGSNYQVFTPFWKACRAQAAIPTPLPEPENTSWYKDVANEKLNDWNLLPSRPNWAKGFEPLWQPGEAGAQKKLFTFLDTAINGYKEDRNLPAGQHTSGLSAHLHFGEISPRQIWHAAHAAHAAGKIQHDLDLDHFLSEVGWREFSHHLIYHFPHLPQKPLNKKFEAMQWKSDPEALAKWQRGLTGYPIVDAGMRELWQTGWMHNRVRMIVASFLIKDLQINWQEGEAWFWDTLLDADLANNVCSWQWVSGCGADAAPYFRIFNPVMQGEKFDPAGAYVRRYVPEISRLSDKWLHRPFEAPKDVLEAAGVRLGENYPYPLIDHHKARAAALAAYAALGE